VPCPTHNSTTFCQIVEVRACFRAVPKKLGSVRRAYFSVTLSAAKGLWSSQGRFLASLRMTDRWRILLWDSPRGFGAKKTLLPLNHERQSSPVWGRRHPYKQAADRPPETLPDWGRLSIFHASLLAEPRLQEDCNSATLCLVVSIPGQKRSRRKG
jgi:hypothetical protein